MIRRIHPLGGPADGGTRLTIYLYDDRLLVDLGGGQCHTGGHCHSGLACRFSAIDGAGNTTHQEVPANLTNCNGARVCGAGWAAMECFVPHWQTWVPGQPAESVLVEVSINGQDFSKGGMMYDYAYTPLTRFTYHDPSELRVIQFRPLAGPFHGGTIVTVSGSRFAKYGDVRCQFGLLNTETNATVVSADRLLCRTPPYWMSEAETPSYNSTSMYLQVTLNGQQYHQLSPSEDHRFTFFRVDTARGLSVTSITPHGGSSLGGTLITLRGTGFHLGIEPATVPTCRFGGSHAEHGAVPATIINAETLKCVSPPRNANATASWSFAVEVGLNDDPVAITAAAKATFTYHEPSHVHSIHPLGGHEAGGLLVTLTGTHFRELSHGDGLQCLFGGSLGTGHGTSTVAIPATLTDREDPSSSIKCFSPPVEKLAYLGVGLNDLVAVGVTNNRVAGPNDQSVDAASFKYFNVSGVSCAERGREFCHSNQVPPPHEQPPPRRSRRESTAFETMRERYLAHRANAVG